MKMRLLFFIIFLFVASVEVPLILYSICFFDCVASSQMFPGSLCLGRESTICLGSTI